MNHKIRITTPFPTDAEFIRILEITPADVAYVNRLMKKMGLRKSAPNRRSATSGPSARQPKAR